MVSDGTVDLSICGKQTSRWSQDEHPKKPQHTPHSEGSDCWFSHWTSETFPRAQKKTRWDPNPRILNASLQRARKLNEFWKLTAGKWIFPFQYTYSHLSSSFPKAPRKGNTQPMSHCCRSPASLGRPQQSVHLSSSW